MRRRSAAGLAVAALLAVWMGPLAESARACSCATRDLVFETARGNAVVVATRTDSGLRGPAVLRVEAADDGSAPVRFTASMDFGGGCSTYLAPGEVGAFLYERRTRTVVDGCGEIDLDRAFLRAAGAPKTASGGAPVAVVAGAFGGSRLAALDAEGRPVAWDGRSGFAEHVVACPDGTTVAVVGRTGNWAGESGPPELSMHDAATLALRRSVALEPAPTDVFPYVYVWALRCTGPDRAELVVKRGDLPAELVTVNGNRTRTTSLGEDVQAAVPLRDGFLLNVGADAPTLVHVDGTGRQRTLVHLPDLRGLERLTVSQDERTIAYVSYDGRQSVVTRDLVDGTQLGRWTADELYVNGLAWTDSRELVVRRSEGYDETPVTPVVLDRTARPVGSWAPVTRLGSLATIGDRVVTYGSARLQAIPRSGPAQTASDPRLAGAFDLTALRPADTFLGATTPATDFLAAGSTDDTARVILAALSGAVVLAAGGALRGGRLQAEP